MVPMPTRPVEPTMKSVRVEEPIWNAGVVSKLFEFTERSADGVVVPPMPVRPVLETVKSVFVDDPMTNAGSKLRLFGLILKRPSGDDVPMPTRPVLVTTRFVAVDEPITNDGPLTPFGLIESMPVGVVVPMPRFVPVVRYVDAPELVKKFEAPARHVPFTA